MYRDHLVQRRAARDQAADAQASADAPTSAHGALRGLTYDQAVQRLAPVQQREDTAAVHDAAARGTAGGGGALPHLAAIQRSFGGHDVSGISAHVGGTASEACDAMGANAYASGDAVAFKGAPDLHTAAHEAAHIVQQRAGVSLSGGVGQVGDSYERNADAVADRVVQGKSAEDLLGAGSGGGAAVQKSAVQRNIATDAWARIKAWFTEVKLSPEQEACAKVLLEKHGVDVSLMSANVFSKHYNDAAATTKDPAKIAADIADLIRPFQAAKKGGGGKGK